MILMDLDTGGDEVLNQDNGNGRKEWLMKRTFVILLFVLSVCQSNQGFASDKITIEVFTDYKKAAAIGFKVNDKQHGSLGKHTKGSGPADQTYFFGMKRGSVFGKNINCGSLRLSKNSKISLVLTDEVCLPQIVS